MGLKTFIRNWLKVKKCDSQDNYNRCICDKTVFFAPESTIQSGNGKESIIIGAHTECCGYLLTYVEGGLLKIGKNCRIGSNTHIIALDKIELGDNVTISWDCNIIDNISHPINPYERRKHLSRLTFSQVSLDLLKAKPIKICDDAWIGCNCVILKGVTIGEAAIVGAGSVVTHDVEPWTIVAGNPAKVIKRIEH